MKYCVDDKTFYDINDVIEYCIDSDYHEEDDYFEEWVNDRYGSIEIYGDSYYAYDILNNCDSYALDRLRYAYCEESNDTDIDEARYDLEHASVGDEIDIQRYTVEVLDESDDSDDDDSGDFDGDDIESVRKFVEEQRIIKEQENIEDKKNEDDLMSLFQTIGG